LIGGLAALRMLKAMFVSMFSASIAAPQVLPMPCSNAAKPSLE